MQTQIEFAIRNRDMGIEAVVNHADRVFDGWKQSAMTLLRDFLNQNNGTSFLAEDVRDYAGLKGLPEPPSKRAWGGVMKAASGKKLIRSVGFGLTKNPLAHRTPATLWTKA